MLVAADAHPDRKVTADRPPHRLEHLEGKPHPLVGRAPVRIPPPVQRGERKLLRR
jgi:hypothetical protein